MISKKEMLMKKLISYIIGKRKNLKKKIECRKKKCKEYMQKKIEASLPRKNFLEYPHATKKKLNKNV